MHANAAERLLQHYVDNSRILPWRSPPGSPPPDPYRVWLSEVMLQQTTVAAVTPRFARFVERWPTIEALAAARDEDILSEWAGLGYYARARNLIACARAVAGLGAFPTREAELRRLPGVGDYTAAAIAALAFGRPVVPVDTNVERVIARLHALPAPAKAQVAELAGAMVPPGRFGDFAQALMDLGATICRARAPACDICPLRSDCAAFAGGDPARFPERRIKAFRPVRHGVAWWIEQGNKVWLVRRPATGLLGGMAALPGPEWSAEPSEHAEAVARVRHVFTHFTLELDIVRRSAPEGRGWWQPIDQIANAGLPTLYRKAFAAALDHRSAALTAAA